MYGDHIKTLKQMEKINKEREQLKKWFLIYSIGGFFLNLVILFFLSIFIKSLFAENFSTEVTMIVCSSYVVSILFCYIFVLFNYLCRIEDQGLTILNEILIEKENQKTMEK